MSNREAYHYGRKLHADGHGIAAAMDIIARLPDPHGFTRWAATDGYSLARRGEQSAYWEGGPR